MNSTETLRHLKRWIKASLLKEFKLHLKGQYLFVEGEERLTSQKEKHIEFRLDGPYLIQLGASHYRAYFEVNLIANSTRDESDKYTRENLQGTLLYILNRDVCIYKIGNTNKEDEDDGQFFEILKQIPHDMIKLSDFGQIDPNVQVYQASAEAHYEIYFTINKGT